MAAFLPSLSKPLYGYRTRNNRRLILYLKQHNFDFLNKSCQVTCSSCTILCEDLNIFSEYVISLNMTLTVHFKKIEYVDIGVICRYVQRLY